MSECYDFPEVVIHDPDDVCGRYRPNGICFPLPMPENPTTQKAKDAVKAYREFKKAAVGLPSEMELGIRFRAPGTTIGPDGGVIE